MTYSTRRYDALCRLGVEQLPSLAIDEHRRSGAEQFGGMSNPLQGHLPLRGVPVPGRRCPCCLQRGQTVWVIPGKKCPQCGTEVN
ncbi:hypothetical protein Q7P37_009351 [Cladosporium fusiforme]